MATNDGKYIAAKNGKIIQLRKPENNYSYEKPKSVQLRIKENILTNDGQFCSYEKRKVIWLRKTEHYIATTNGKYIAAKERNK